MFHRLTVAALGSLAAFAASALTFSDGFDAGAIDTFYWTVQTFDGSTATAANQRIEMVQGAGPVVGGGANLVFNHAITGDFTVDVDYTLLNWPANSFERAGLRALVGAPPAVTALAAIARVSDTAANYGYDEFYGSFFEGTSGPPFHQNVVGSSDLSGRLRMQRVGQTMSTYYWAGSAWQLLGSHSEASQLVPVNLSFGIAEYPTDTPGVSVAFDNFNLVAPQTNLPAIPEPHTWALMTGGLAAVGWLTRRRRAA